MNELAKRVNIISVLLLVIAAGRVWSAPSGSAAGVTLWTPGEGARFQQLGIDASGAVVIISSTASAEYWRFLNGEFTYGVFETDDSSENLVNGISRDARYVVGESLPAEGGLSRGMIWPMATPSSPIALPPVEGLEGNHVTRPFAVASTCDGPVVVGRVAGGSFRWSFISGYTLWPATQDGRFLLESVSADGNWLAGSHDSGSRFQAAAGGLDDMILLDDADAINSFAASISPNGRHLCGFLSDERGGHGVVWSADSLPVVLEADSFLGVVTDSGLAGGTANERAILWDPQGRKMVLFDDWWERMFPETPLPAPIVNVMDLYEYQGCLYALVRARFEAGNADDYMAIVPFHTPAGRKLGLRGPWQE